MPETGFVWHNQSRLHLNGTDTGRHNAILSLQSALQGGQPFAVSSGEIRALGSDFNGYLATQTSGSSGDRKTILRRQQSWIDSFMIHRETFDLGPNDSYGILGSITNSTFLFAATEAAHLGADIRVAGSPNPNRQLECLQRAGTTVLYLTPSLLGLLCRTGGVLSDIRLVVFGGGTTSPDLVAATKQLCPNAQVIHFYGSAETSFVAWDAGGGASGTVGIPYPEVELLLEPVDGDIGEIWVRSPYLFDRYLDGKSTDTRWRDGFLTVGELGQLRDGQLYVVGRRNRMVTIADTNVFPELIEEYLLRQPMVRNCAVLAVDDDRRGKVLVAVIDGGDPDTLGTACRDRFGPLASPRRFHVTESFPVSEAGKPDFPALRSMVEAPK